MREEGTPQPGEQYQHKSCSELSQPCEWPEGVGGCGSPEKCRRRVKGPTIAAPGPSAVQPEDIGFLDWNTLTMDQLTEHLTREFSMHSSGTAFAVMKMIAEVSQLQSQLAAKTLNATALLDAAQKVCEHKNFPSKPTDTGIQEWDNELHRRIEALEAAVKKCTEPGAPPMSNEEYQARQDGGGI